MLELELKKDYLGNEEITTIYFGGGTPSLLTYDDLSKIRDKITSIYRTNNIIEFTLEANPDDLNTTKIKELLSIGVNRLSIGIQSFQEIDLQYMHRAHNANEALNCIYTSQDAGIENISIDLIYGTPTLKNSDWKNNLNIALSTQVPHISAYALTVEPKTKLASLIKKKIKETPKDDLTAEQFYLLQETLIENQFEQYEISNFCKNQQYAVHNTSYWKGIHYLGIGPSAHSYNGYSRSWNINNNFRYIRDVKNNSNYFETEILTLSNKVNEYIMTSLRTNWGLSLIKVEHEFGKTVREAIELSVKIYLEKTHYTIKNDIIYLSKDGKFMADGIASNLFIDENEL